METDSRKSGEDLRVGSESERRTESLMRTIKSRIRAREKDKVLGKRLREGQSIRWESEKATEKSGERSRVTPVSTVCDIGVFYYLSVVAAGCCMAVRSGIPLRGIRNQP